MATKARHFLKFFLAGLMALIGFSSCSKDKSSMLVMYGTPYGSLDIKAKIVDNNDSPLNDTKIRVRLEEQGTHYTYNPYSVYDSPGYDFQLNKKSNVSGNIDTVLNRLPIGPNSKETFFVYYAKDNPSHEGKYSDDSVRITPVRIEDAEDWYWGKYKLEGTLKLKEKPAESE